MHIPLPGMLSSLAKGLRVAGQGHYVDTFETIIDRAAEAAIPETLAFEKIPWREPRASKKRYS